MRRSGWSPRARACGVVLVLATLAVLSGCSGGGGGTTDDSSDAAGDMCTLIERVDSIATTLEGVDVSDPDAFHQTVDAALLDLSEALDALVDAVPADARRDVQTMSTLVEERKFADALAYRFRLDDVAVTECDAPAS